MFRKELGRILIVFASFLIDLICTIDNQLLQHLPCYSLLYLTDGIISISYSKPIHGGSVLSLVF